MKWISQRSFRSGGKFTAQKCWWVMKRDCELLFFFIERVFQVLQPESKTGAVSPTLSPSYSLTLVLQVYFMWLLNGTRGYAGSPTPTRPRDIVWNTHQLAAFWNPLVCDVRPAQGHSRQKELAERKRSEEALPEPAGNHPLSVFLRLFVIRNSSLIYLKPHNVVLRMKKQN